MNQALDFSVYVIEQLAVASGLHRNDFQARERFNAVSIHHGDLLIGLIVNATLFFQLSGRDAHVLLPGVQPFSPAGVTLESRFFPVPLALIADVEQLRQCLRGALMPQAQRQVCA